MPWASCQIRKIVGCACAGNAGNVFPCRRLQRKLLVSDPDMHHGTCVTHVPWCMSGSLTRGVGENVPGIPGACAPAILCIWQEAHCSDHLGGMMTSWHGIAFLITSLVWAKTTNTSCRAINPELWCFPFPQPEEAAKQTVEDSVIWSTVTLIWRVIVMEGPKIQD